MKQRWVDLGRLRLTAHQLDVCREVLPLLPGDRSLTARQMWIGSRGRSPRRDSYVWERWRRALDRLAFWGVLLRAGGVVAVRFRRGPLADYLEESGEV